MSIEISSETLLTVPQAAQRLPGQPHISSLHRWRSHGVRGVKLETVLIGGRRFTSVEALERFAARTTAAAEGQPLPIRSSKERERAIQRAEKGLGITPPAVGGRR